MSERKYVFISYSTKNQQFANSVKQVLNENNIKTWMAPYDIPVGSEYGAVINNALEKCTCLLLLLSNDSQESVWVRKEVERATSYKKIIYPIQIENVILNDSFKFFLGNSQILALPSLNLEAPEFKNLLSLLHNVLGEDVEPETDDDDVTTPTPPSIQESQTKNTSFLRLLMAGFVILSAFVTTLMSLNDSEYIIIALASVVPFTAGFLTKWKNSTVSKLMLYTGLFFATGYGYAMIASPDEYIAVFSVLYSLCFCFLFAKCISDKATNINIFSLYTGIFSFMLALNEDPQTYVTCIIAIILAIVSAYKLHKDNVGEKSIALLGMIGGFTGIFTQLLNINKDSYIILFVIGASVISCLFAYLLKPKS